MWWNIVRFSTKRYLQGTLFDRRLRRNLGRTLMCGAEEQRGFAGQGVFGLWAGFCLAEEVGSGLGGGEVLFGAVSAAKVGGCGLGGVGVVFCFGVDDSGTD